MAHGKHFTTEELTERFTIVSKVRTYILGAIGLGLVLVIAGLLLAKDPHAHHSGDAGHDEHAALIDQSSVHKVADPDQAHGDEHAEGHGGGHGPQHTVTKYTNTLANFLINNIYFLTLAMGAMFFIAVHRVGNAGWQTAIRRIPEAISMWLPAAIVGFAVVAAFGGQLYDWIAVPEGADALIDKKRAYLNVPFWIGRGVLFLGGWYLVAIILRRLSIRQDSEGGLSHFKKSLGISAAFIIFFAFSYTLFSIDWVKSLEPHWFSTIFGVYVFAGSMATVTAVMGLILHFLKKQGYMQYTNDAHLHDLYKYAFGFSVFWGYIFIAQYLLIWYSNLPEETMYYEMRLDNYQFWFGLKIFLCFVVPFLGFMTRNGKRRSQIFVPLAILMMIGHWVDMFLLVMPGAIGADWHFGLTEVGMFILYLGIFSFVVLTALTKANLVPLKHPYLEESLHHSTGAV